MYIYLHMIPADFPFSFNKSSDKLLLKLRARMTIIQIISMQNQEIIFIPNFSRYFFKKRFSMRNLIIGMYQIALTFLSV